MLAWHIPYRDAILSQVGISAAALAAAIAGSLLATSTGILGGEASVVLGVAVFLFAWEVGLAVLIPWFADQSRQSELLPFRLRRLRWSVSVVMLWLGCAGGVAAFALTRFVDGPAGGPGGQDLAQSPAANGGTSARAEGAARQSPAPDGQAPAVMVAVHAWAAAWARRDVVRYLGSYAYHFRTPNGESRANWEATRRDRIEKATRIAVRIESPQVIFVDERTATVRFRQHYESDILTDRGSKTLVMTRVGSEWRILEERSRAK